MRTNLLRNVAGGVMAAALGAGVAAYSPAMAAGEDQIFQRRGQPVTNANMSREEAEAVGKRLYKGLFNREADAEGLNDTITMLQKGQLQRRVNDMIASAEFKTRNGRTSAPDMLNQLYRGLLDRDPDSSGVNAYQGQLQNRRYADVVLHMLQSEEFRNKINADLGRSGSATSGTPSGSTMDTGAAAGCMEQITEKVRNDLPGAVLLRFETATTEGTAIDVLDNNRRIRYNCNGASYSYEDGRNSRSAPNETDFGADERARACQASVRSQITRDRNGVDVAFESAGVLAAGSSQAVRGLGFERPQGANFTYDCLMDGNRVVNSSYRMR
jgi:hypothetical protein